MSLSDHGWKFSEPYASPKNADMVAKMVEELSKIPREKKPPTKIQTAAMQAIIEAQAKRDPKDDEAYWAERDAKPIENWKAVPDAATLDEAVGMRFFTPSEVAIHEDIRHKQRNQLGESKESSVTPEKREKGIQAFAYSPPATLTKEEIKRLTQLVEIQEAPMLPIQDETSRNKTFKDWPIFNVFFDNWWKTGKR